MTKLRKQMLEDLQQRRNYAESTQLSYIRHVAEFAKLFDRNPADLGPEEVKQFQLHLLQQKKVSWGNLHSGDGRTPLCLREDSRADLHGRKIPYPRRPKHLPAVLSQERSPGCWTPPVRSNTVRLLMALYERAGACPKLASLSPTISTAIGW